MRYFRHQNTNRRWVATTRPRGDWGDVRKHRVFLHAVKNCKHQVRVLPEFTLRTEMPSIDRRNLCLQGERV